MIVGTSRWYLWDIGVHWDYLIILGFFVYFSMFFFSCFIDSFFGCLFCCLCCCYEFFYRLFNCYLLFYLFLSNCCCCCYVKFSLVFIFFYNIPPFLGMIILLLVEFLFLYPFSICYCFLLFCKSWLWRCSRDICIFHCIFFCFLSGLLSFLFFICNPP